MERKFLVLLRRFSLRKEQSNYDIFVCSFLHLRDDPRRIQFGFKGDVFAYLACVMLVSSDLFPVSRCSFRTSEPTLGQ